MIRIKSNTRAEIGRLFSCLEFGEQLAHDCAVRQSRLTTDGKLQHFLRRQALQEAQHARVFGRVISCVTPYRRKPVPHALLEFRSRLERCLHRNDLVESLVGQQVVLEGFGELILHRMNRKFDQYALGFKRLRRMILHQERGHQAFGERFVYGLIVAGAVSEERVGDIMDEYLDLANDVLTDLQSVFDVVGADADLYKNELRLKLPQWTGVRVP